MQLNQRLNQTIKDYYRLIQTIADSACRRLKPQIWKATQNKSTQNVHTTAFLLSDRATKTILLFQFAKNINEATAHATL